MLDRNGVLPSYAEAGGGGQGGFTHVLRCKRSVLSDHVRDAQLQLSGNSSYMYVMYVLQTLSPAGANTLPSGTLATFFLTAVGPIQNTNEDDIGREKTILMM